MEHDLFGKSGNHPLRIKSEGRLFPDHAPLIAHTAFGGAQFIGADFCTTLLTTALFAFGAGRLPFPAFVEFALAQDPTAGKKWRHGLSLFGDLKYPPNFPHFDYVDPAAPKGGTVREAVIGTFDNFNTVVSGVKGVEAAGVELIYDTLLVSALDEVSTGSACLRKRSTTRRISPRPPTGCAANRAGMTASR